MSTMPKVLVTGAGGFIASHIVYQLLDQGYSVRGTVRSKDDPRSSFLKEASFHSKAPENVELVSGDLLKAEGWSDAIEGCKYVLHTASPFNMKMDEATLVTTAVSGTKNVLNAIGEYNKSFPTKKVQKVVLTSSVASVITGHPYTKGQAVTLLTEETYSKKENTHGYELSKLEAEQAAWAISKQYDFNMDTICPGLVMGPIMAKHHGVCQSSEYIRTLLKNTLFLGVNINLPLTDVRDVAALHIRAMQEEEATGNRYISTADGHCASNVMNVSKILNETIASKSNWSPPVYEVPEFLARFIALFHPEMKPARQFIGYPFGCSNEKAKKHFNFTFRPMNESIKQHAISLFKFGEMESNGYPQEEIDSLRAY